MGIGSRIQSIPIRTNHIPSALRAGLVDFLADSFWWPIVFVISGIWQGAGWGTIIYLVAISAIDPELYEAARIDGANKLAQIWHITLPGIKSTIAILLILRMGGMMDVGFEHIYNLQNPVVFNVADVISTYVYRIGIRDLKQNNPNAELLPVSPFKTSFGSFDYHFARFRVLKILCINKDSKNVESIMKFADWQLSGGWRITSYGIEGRHYQLVNGVPVVIDADLNKQEMIMPVRYNLCRNSWKNILTKKILR
jgi:hypothetical protein